MRGAANYRPISPQSRKTFGQAAIKWLDEWQGKDKQRQAIAIKHLLPYIGTTPLYKVNNAALSKYKEDRLKSVMASTLNKELTLVVTIMNHAATIWEWIDYVPKIVRVQGPKKVALPLTWEEQDRLFYHLPDWWAEGPCLFAVNTGMRASEVFGLKWEHVEPFNDRYVAIVDGKNGFERVAVCNKLASLALERQERDSEYVFPSRCSRTRGKRITNWNRMFRDAWDAARLPSGPLDKRGIHNLRHTFGYRLRRAGCPAEDRRLLLGHENANMMEHYAEPDLERLMGWAEKVTVRPEGGEFMLRSIRNRG